MQPLRPDGHADLAHAFLRADFSLLENVCRGYY